MSMDLKPTTVLQRVPELSLKVYSNDCASIIVGGQVTEGSLHTLPVLDAFSKPRTLADALERLQGTARSAQDWVDLTSTIVQLFTAGVLRDPAQSAPGLRPAEKGFDAASIHVKMLNDRARTQSYLEAIRAVVQTGDIVVDIGTGTGVLAIAAARAGARHVYAIEATAIGNVAETIFKANGLDERITLVPGWSSQVDLPQRADVLVSEIIGNEPLGEQVIETTRDALSRLLKPDARLIPGQIRIFGIPVVVPDSMRAAHVFTGEALDRWHSWYGINFAPLANVETSPYLFFSKPIKTREWDFLSEPVLLAEIDLRTIERFMIDASATAEVHSEGALNGLIVYFDLQLSPEITLTTHPARADEHCSWVTPVWLLPEPIPVTPKNQVTVTYKHRVTGEQGAVTVARA